MAIANEFQLQADYKTLRQAADIKGCSYDALRLYVYLNRNKIPTFRVGKTIIVKMSDLESYVPRGARHVVGA